MSSFVGQTPPRYYLANAAYGPQPNYAQCLVEADTPEKSRELQAMLYDRLPVMFPDALVRVNSFEINSIPQALIEARFCGDDPEVLDSLTNLALEIMRKNPKVLNARNEWGNMALMIKADYDPVKAGRLNVGRHDMMNAVKAVNDGTAVGVYRDRDKKVPVLLHTDVKGSWDMESVEDLPIWNGRNSAPLGQVADGVRLEVETAYYTYTQAVRQVCLTESSLAKAATSEQLAMDKYKEGTISIVEVLNAQMYHQEAELNHIRSKLRAQLAKSSLERAAGRLGEY